MAIKVNCNFCEKELLREPYRLLINKNQYCNNKCRFHSMRKARTKVHCDSCGDELIRTQYQISHNKTGKFFCGFDCRSQFYKKEYQVVCVVCGDNFEKVPAEQKRYPVHCCSIQCRNKLNDKRQVKYCWCGKKTFRPPSILKGKKNVFCSIKCYNIFQDLKESVICDKCGVEFKKQLCIIGRSRHNFCSTECFSRYSFNDSFVEIELERLILIQNIGVKVVRNDRTVLRDKNETDGRRGLELDFYFPEIKFAVEVNGRAHYLPVYGEEVLARQKVRDSKKRRLCKELGIKLRIVKPGDCKIETYLPRYKRVIWEIRKEINNGFS